MLYRWVFKISAVLLISGFITWSQGWAATHNVGTAMELMMALYTAADNGEDDLIKIKQGTYSGYPFNYRSYEAFGLTIQGGYASDFSTRQVDANNTVLNGSAYFSALFLSSRNRAGTFNIDGLTLQNGANYEGGGGLNVDDCDAVILSNCVITDNSTMNKPGGGVSITDVNTVTLTDNVIENNTAQGHGGGVYISIYQNQTSGRSVTIQNNKISDNTIEDTMSGNGGGIYVSGSDSLLLINNTISDNIANTSDLGFMGLSTTNQGGGVLVYECDSITISDNVIASNKATSAGGVSVGRCTGYTTFENNTIMDNTAASPSDLSAGGGVRLSDCDGPVTFVQNTITGNTVSSGSFASGGAVQVWGTVPGPITFTENTIENNTASSAQEASWGGGIDVSTMAEGDSDHRTVMFSENDIKNNTATALSESGASYGGGMNVSVMNYVTLTFHDNTITDNAASSSSLQDSEPSEGGGVHVTNTNLESIDFSRNTIKRNTSSGPLSSFGGGVYILDGDMDTDKDTVTFTDNWITDNTASAGSYSLGGGVAYLGTDCLIGSNWLTFANNIIANNSAEAATSDVTASDVVTEGGGIYIYYNSELINIINNTIHNNSAVNGGGIKIDYFKNKFTYFYNNIFSQNLASDTGRNIYLNDDEDHPPEVTVYHNNLDLSATSLTAEISDEINVSGNISSDPGFINALDEDFSLSDGSPCINAGDNDAPELPDTDIAGQDRIRNGVVDMGAYEHESGQNNTDECDGNGGEGCPVIPEKATLMYPVGSTQETSNKFAWNDVSGVQWYKLVVMNDVGENVHSQWYEPSNVCTQDTCEVLPESELLNGAYEWWVKTWTDQGAAWSDGMTFTVQGLSASPLKVKHTSPSGPASSSSPVFFWVEDAAATWYKLWVGYTGDQKLVAQWFDAAQICADGTCSVVLDTSFSAGSYEWYVKSWNDNGRVWSDGMGFDVVDLEE